MYDPVNGQVTLLADFNPGGGGSLPIDFLVIDDTLVFFGNDGTVGSEPFMLTLPEGNGKTTSKYWSVF